MFSEPKTTIYSDCIIIIGFYCSYQRKKTDFIYYKKDSQIKSML